jgi:LmbE family N-acetylglucosaminyl deacetylase
VSRAGVRQRLGRMAVDITDGAIKGSALVLAAHPDDETIACGGVILRKVAAGQPVTIYVASDGRASHDSQHITPHQLAAMRREEMSECARRLGVEPDDVRWAGFPDGALRRHEKELTAQVRALIDELKPDEVYVTGAFEPHADHAVLGRAARRASRSSDSRVLEYPIWLWSQWPLPRRDGLSAMVNAALVLGGLRRRALRIDVGEHAPAKAHALAAHVSQVGRPVGLPDGVPWELLPPAIDEVAECPYELFLPYRR